MQNEGSDTVDHLLPMYLARMCFGVSLVWFSSPHIFAPHHCVLKCLCADQADEATRPHHQSETMARRAILPPAVTVAWSPLTVPHHQESEYVVPLPSPTPTAPLRPPISADPPLPPLLSSRLIMIERSDLELGAQLGHGAFGVVYRGRLLRSTGADVAVKVLDVARVKAKLGLERPDALRAFHWEAINLALCDHPGIVEMMGLCVDPATDFRAIVLEFCAGGDLQRALHAQPADVWRWAVQLAEALRHLHTSGQVHRDIKGENVLLNGDRRVAKFGDLGVSDADEEFVGDRLGAVRGFSQKDVRWAAPEELAAPQTQVQTEVSRCV
jgi:hypothetical protein